MNGQDAYIAVVGAVNVDISGTPEDALFLPMPPDACPEGSALEPLARPHTFLLQQEERKQGGDADALLRFLDFFYCEIGGLYTWDGPVAGSDDLLGFAEGWVYDYSTGSTGSRIFLDVAAGKYSSGTEYVKGVIGANCIGFGNRSHSLTNEKLTYMYEITQYVQDPTMENFVPYVWAEDHGDGWARIHIKANVAPYAVSGFPEIVYFDEDTQEAVDEIRMVMDAYIETNVAKFVTGARDLAEFDQFVKEIEDLGLRDLEEIYQEAYDAYLAAK